MTKSTKYQLFSMKNIFITSLLLLTLVFAPAPALAQTSAGTTPGSFLYFFDTTFEKINLFFTFDSERKAQKALEYADERLAEIREIANDNKPKRVESAMADYENKISLATERAGNLEEEKASALLNIISEKTETHQKTLSGILNEVPEEAKEAITKAIEVSKRGQDEANRRNDELRSEVERLRAEIAELKAENENVENETNKTESEKPESEKKSTNVEPTTRQPSVQPEETTPTVPVTVNTPTPAEKKEDAAPKVSTDALGSELLEFLNEQIAEQVKSDLDYYQRTISDLKDLVKLQQNNASQGKQNCLASYESKVEYAKDDAERQKTTYYESRSGFASSPRIVENIDKQLERDLEDIERWKESCLAQYEVNTSVESRLNRVSSDLNSIKQRLNRSSGSVSTSEVNAIRNEITSIAGVLANSVGVSGSISLPTVRSMPSSVTCTDGVSGFSCRDNFGSNVMRCSQTSPGFLNCTDSNFNNVSCQTGVVPGSMRCSW